MSVLSQAEVQRRRERLAPLLADMARGSFGEEVSAGDVLDEMGAHMDTFVQPSCSGETLREIHRRNTISEDELNRVAKPTPELSHDFMLSAHVPARVIEGATRYSPSEALEAYRGELTSNKPGGALSAWVASRTSDNATVAGAWLCGWVRNARYVDAPSYVLSLDGMNRYGTDSRNGSISGLGNVSLLVLDGAEQATWNEQSAVSFAAMLGLRRKNGLPTVWAASCDLSAFLERLSASAGSDATHKMAFTVSRSVGRTKAEQAAHMMAV